MLCFLAIIPNHTPVKNSENFANFPFILHHHYQSLLGAIERGGVFFAGRGKGKNLRGGAKKRINQLVQKFDKRA